MAWTFVICDLAGRSLGEPRAYQRRCSFGVSRVATAGFRVRDSDPLWDQMAAGAATLKVFDSGDNLRLYGSVVGDEETGDGQGAQTQVAAADLVWRLGKRYVARDTTGVGTTYTATDAGTIAFAVLALVNADEATGITAGTTGTFVTRTVTYLWKRSLDALAELGAVAGSYEWGLRYTDGTPPTVNLDLAAKMGTDRSTSVFLEYGTGKSNCKRYRRVRTIDQLATDLWVLGGGSSIVVSASDAAARTTYKRHEDVISYPDISVSTLLDALAAAHVAIRKQPRVIVELTPFAQTAPKYGVDYQLGDVVTARVYSGGSARVNGAVRIWGVDIDVDELGNEQATLRLVADA